MSLFNTRIDRILVADDDAPCREALVEFFQRQGCIVTFARSGDEAIQVLRSTPVDVSVMDVNMPGMSGLQVVRALLDDPRGSGVPPTVFVSSDLSVATAVQALLRNVRVDFVPKPVQLEALRRSLEALVGPRN
jgi:two-component system response regulator PhoP